MVSGSLSPFRHIPSFPQALLPYMAQLCKGSLSCLSVSFCSSVTLAIYYHIKNRYVVSIVDHFTWKDKSGAAGTIGAELGRSLCRKLTSLFCFVARDSNRSVDICDEKKHPLTVSFVPGENPPPCVCVCV